MNEYLNLWNETLDFLKEEVPNDFDSLFANITDIAKVENNYIYMVVPNALIKYRIERFYQEKINNYVKKIHPTPIGFKFINEKDLNELESQKKSADIKQERSISRSLSSLYTFNTFAVGESNRFAFLSAMKVAESREKVYNPLYIFGGVGLGKTHLMTAIGNYILDNDITANVIYTSSQKFAEDYFLATSSRNGKEKIEEFYNKYNNADVLLVDDIQFLENKLATQEEFFKIFENLVNKNKQIVITSDKPANELKNVMSRLVSRFNWGLTVNIKQPDLNLCVSVLKSKLEGMVEDPNIIPIDVLNLLANYFHNNIRDLEGALRTYINYCTFMKLPFNEDSVYSALDSILPKESIANDNSSSNVKKVKDIVCDYFKISVNDIDSNSRKAQFVYARQIIMYILKNTYNLSLKSIGSHLGNKDHTTVLHGIDKIDVSLRTNPMIKTDVDFLLKKLEK